ncbi:MAG: glycosyl hydrolase [Bacteroidetes bacterium]|nr:MAG: glycosyl hydrolase [Bacteroidota bacterium]
MKYFKQLLTLSLLISLSTYAQDSQVKNVPFTNIGPTIMSGRVVDFDVNPDNPIEFYVAYATGGLWYTKNNGTSFTSLTENAPTQNMGDIAVDWNAGTIWIGTGESNSSRSSYAGIGILKSTDKGKTWQNVGLPDSHHIGRIVINKNNPNEVIVGALGHLYTSNAERGIYKTTDGGKTWNNVLFINNDTGIIDISVSPTNPEIMYAASWERERKAWDFDGDGENSAIYKSIDAGSTWTKLTAENSGFPTGSGVGRIGLSAFNDNTVYALLDNQFRRPSGPQRGGEGMQKEEFKTMSNTAFLALDDNKLDGFLRGNRFDQKYTAASVKKSVRQGDVKPSDLALYLEDANSVMFNSEVIGAEVYKSSDGGATWTKTHKGYIDGLYSSYGYYFGVIAVNPSNQNKIYLLGVPILKSDDGGATFNSIGKENVHSDHQAIWVNPKMDGHVINGNDGGVNITYDDGENWTKNNSPAVGQFYYITVDNQKPYNVYGGLQDNGVWFGPSNYVASKDWEDRGQYPYKGIGGGDGMQVQVDSRNHNIVYSGSQFGSYSRQNLETGDRIRISPRHELGDSPYRYNWQTPILLSSHNQDILYMGSNKLLRSMDQGENFDVISGDLTTGGKKGNVPYGTLATISESPFQFGLIYTGSDDGYINMTNNSGDTWTRVSNNLPQGLWVSRVVASQHSKSRVYATLNGYRNDDFKAYVYMSNDYGKTWKDISANLPDTAAVNVIKEDTESENLVYLGTDNGIYASFDNGGNWEAFANGLNTVPVHDLVVHPEAKDLLVGTHGRSIYKADISALQNHNAIGSKAIAIFDTEEIQSNRRWGMSWGSFSFDPETTISFYSNAKAKLGMNILSEGGALLNTIPVNADAGYNYATYDVTMTDDGKKALQKENSKLRISQAQNGKIYLPAGTYTIQIGSQKTTLVVK